MPAQEQHDDWRRKFQWSPNRLGPQENTLLSIMLDNNSSREVPPYNPSSWAPLSCKPINMLLGRCYPMSLLFSMIWPERQTMLGDYAHRLCIIFRGLSRWESAIPLQYRDVFSINSISGKSIYLFRGVISQAWRDCARTMILRLLCFLN